MSTELRRQPPRRAPRFAGIAGGRLPQDPGPSARAVLNATLVDVVAQVEPALPRARILEVLDRVATNKSKRRRIVDALAADPGLLTCGRPDGPVAVDQLIHALLAAGAEHVVAPACPECGRTATLSERAGSTRICLPCRGGRRLIGRSCASCGQGFQVSSRDRQGRLVCRACRGDRDLDPVAAICAHIAEFEPTMPLEVLRAAVATVSKQRYDLVKLAWELEDHPGLLTGRGAEGSPRLIRLIEALHAAGAEHVVAPACPRCGRTARLTRSLDDRRVCRGCYDKATAKVCSSCDRRRPISGRMAGGQPLCLRCYNRDPFSHEQCARCGRLWQVRRRTPEGPLCTACYRLPTAVCSLCGRTRPCFAAATGMPRCETCSEHKQPCARCGNLRQAAARIPEGYLCWACYTKDPVSFKTCAACGTVERLYHYGLCARCACDQLLGELLVGPEPARRAKLEPLHRALRDADPRQMLRWLASSDAAAVLIDIAAGRCPLTHEALDERLPAKASRHLRGVLVTAGVLPPRDEHLADLERWLAATLAVVDSDRQRLIRAFVTWHHLGRLRRRLRGRPANAHQVTGVRASVRAALALLRWLDAHQLTLASCRQADIDRWIADGPSTRYQARTFLQWAVQRGAAANVEIPDPARRTQTEPLAAEQRWKRARWLLNDATIPTADRIAGLFILLYAQPVSAIARLTTDRIATHDAGVHVQFGDTRLLLLDPLAELVAEHLESRRSYAIVGRKDPTPWLFPGAHPGQHISEGHLGRRLARLGIYSHPGRHAALLDLSTQLPAAVLSRLLGVSASTADRWTTRSGNSWAGYAAAVQRRGQRGEPDLR